MEPNQTKKVLQVRQIVGDKQSQLDDFLAVEEPMEIRVVFGPEEKRSSKSLSITMRTPGNDFELAAGFLFTEGILQNAAQIRGFEFRGEVAEGRTEGNIVEVELQFDLDVDLKKLQRHFYTTSSCGICGKGSLDAIRNIGIEPIAESDSHFDATVIRRLPERLRESQKVFESTGGIHAAGLFAADGSPICIREDVGRHNALDKLIGHQFLDNQLPIGGKIIVVSGRTSFELVQKSIAAGVEMLVAVGAPSSLAVELAREFNLTLIGFASTKRLNVYSCENRVR